MKVDFFSINLCKYLTNFFRNVNNILYKVGFYGTKNIDFFVISFLSFEWTFMDYISLREYSSVVQYLYINIILMQYKWK